MSVDYARFFAALCGGGVEFILVGGTAANVHGSARLTQDVDIVLPADRLDDFLSVAAVSGFDLMTTSPGRWPKLLHKETNVQVDILPEGERPGTTSRPAPTTIRHPTAMGVAGHTLRYLSLPCLIELKLAAGRPRDEADVTELVRVNEDQVAAIRQHLAGIHADYVAAFDRLAQRAHEQYE